MQVDARVLDSALEQFRSEGYTIIRNFIPADEVATLRAETKKLYETAIAHHATYKHGNLTYEILPETHRNGHQNRATAGLLIGLVLMMFLDVALAH